MKYHVGDLVETREELWDGRLARGTITRICTNTFNNKIGYEVEYFPGWDPYQTSGYNIMTDYWFTGKLDIIKPSKSIKKFEL